ncbi:MAG: hypothetical protein O3A84_04930 [Proteobacteria bacterium]|nr:hypothetical protein [Pseudomonadota bacterium]
MTSDSLSPAIKRFIDYFGNLGPRWGLSADACRIHALVYVLNRPVSNKEISESLGLNKHTLRDAIDYLIDYKMIFECSPSIWTTSGDPWEMLMVGLEERRKRELPLALETLQQCQEEARSDDGTEQTSADQIGKMLNLVGGLGAIDAQFRRLPPRLVRGLVDVSSKAARMFGGVPANRR